jgi:hypothetical protein
MSKVRMNQDMPDAAFYERLQAGIQDERLRSLVWQVYQRLPSCDRQVLCQLVAGFKELKFEKGSLSNKMYGNVIAGVTMTGEGTWIGDIEIASKFRLDFLPLQSDVPDATYMYLIAHEFAHVVLRHGLINQVVEFLGVRPDSPSYGEEDYPNLMGWHEDEADLLAVVWGFQREMVAFFESYPDARRPRWYELVGSVGVLQARPIEAVRIFILNLEYLEERCRALLDNIIAAKESVLAGADASKCRAYLSDLRIRLGELEADMSQIEAEAQKSEFEEALSLQKNRHKWGGSPPPQGTQ